LLSPFFIFVEEEFAEKKLIEVVSETVAIFLLLLALCLLLLLPFTDFLV
jgi:hypothetical protein